MEMLNRVGRVVSRWVRRDDEVPHEVLAHLGEVEIRRYPARVTAVTEITGDRASAYDEAFRRLAEYILGDNERGERLALMTPVERTFESERIVLAFTLATSRALASLPRPRNPHIHVHEAPGRLVAVAWFSGRAHPLSTQRQVAILRRRLSHLGLVVEGEPVLAAYDPPSVAGPLRRTEILLPVGRGTS